MHKTNPPVVETDPSGPSYACISFSRPHSSVQGNLPLQLKAGPPRNSKQFFQTLALAGYIWRAVRIGDVRGGKRKRDHVLIPGDFACMRERNV